MDMDTFSTNSFCYEEINTSENDTKGSKSKSSTGILFKQVICQHVVHRIMITFIIIIVLNLFVVSSTWMAYFLNGLGFGLPTVMIPQIRKAANSTDAISPEMASWLYSVFSYAAIPWVVIICISTRFVGRKIPFMLVCLNMFVYFNLLYFSTTVNQVLIAEIMQGVTHGAHVSVTAMIVTEYASPKYRGLFATIKSANFYWGIWVANAVGTFVHWKYIPLVGIFLSLFYLTVLFWPESPQWLASTGQFEKCRTEHRWLRGTDEQSEKELGHLIQAQTEYITKKNRRYSYFKTAITTICSKSFYKPMFLTILLMTQYVASGKMVFGMYSIVIIKEITTNESTAYMGMLILDGVTIVGLYTGCILSRFLNRRTVLFSGCISGISFLVLISFYLFITESGYIVENKIVSLALLTLFSVCISYGPLVLVTSIAHELTPLRYKSSITMISALSFSIESGTMLKLFPAISTSIHMSGIFLMNAIMSGVCCTMLYIYLPETKDKTLQEIEDILMKNKTLIMDK